MTMIVELTAEELKVAYNILLEKQLYLESLPDEEFDEIEYQTVHGIATKMALLAFEAGLMTAKELLGGSEDT